MTTPKRPLIYVPIESLVERYTEQWRRLIPPALENAGYDVTVIDGVPLHDTVKVGTFLDINSTVSYKMSQLQKIAGMFSAGSVIPGTVFFFGDIEFWGLESVRLMADMNGVPVVITGFLHAASYTREDAFQIAEPYQQYTEVGWIAACDKVFVGSYYHRAAVTTRRLWRLNADRLGTRIVVTSNPIFLEAYDELDRASVKKQKKVLITNRPDSEKRPLETLELFRKAKLMFPDWEFVLTSSRDTLKSNSEDIVSKFREAEAEGIITIKVGLTKQQYHQELAESWVMVSHSIEENYGYCLVEALLYGCAPLCRMGLSHTELLKNDPRLLFHSNDLGMDLTLLNNLLITYRDDLRAVPSLPPVFLGGMESIIRELNVSTPRTRGS